MADPHVALALCQPSPVPLFDIPPPPPALKPDICVALGLQTAGQGPDPASFVADAASACCSRFVVPPPSLYALQLRATAAAAPPPYITGIAGAGLIEAEVTRHSMHTTAAVAAASICHEALSNLPLTLRSALLHVPPPRPCGVVPFPSETVLLLQAQAGGDAAQALAGLALYLETAGQVARVLEHMPPQLLQLREDRTRAILTLHTKVTYDS
jgi:hypothetical protein